MLQKQVNTQTQNVREGRHYETGVKAVPGTSGFSKSICIKAHSKAQKYINFLKENG